MNISRANEFEQVIRSGGIVLFPSDTVYGLAVDPDNEAAVRAMSLKRRQPEKPSARMYFDIGTALRDLPPTGPRTLGVLTELLPGPATIVLPEGLGLRVVDVPQLAGATVSVLQSSANLSGQPDARILAAVERRIRDAVDLEIDGGELPGIPSTVIDLRTYERSRDWKILRPGALSEVAVEAVLNR